jgi:hypothetical protein
MPNNHFEAVQVDPVVPGERVTSYPGRSLHLSGDQTTGAVRYWEGRREVSRGHISFPGGK